MKLITIEYDDFARITITPQTSMSLAEMLSIFRLSVDLLDYKQRMVFLDEDRKKTKAGKKAKKK